ncbi:MAG TPA: UDP-N-acetylglucosamine 1-carboxyvinyltransferase [Tenericutes bacterium]|nr:UDP-N-acetylglucosamine 1-carboxyvinyltransferase [Mycoplasmatota bacterium]
MKKILINGGKELKGQINVGGAKNSAVALIPAALLSDDVVEIYNVPNISDIKSLEEILEYLGAKVSISDGKVMIDCTNVENKKITEEFSKKLRASYYFMSVLLGKYKKADVYFPGGCNIGARPIDQTLKAFRALGAVVEEENNRFKIYAEKLVGCNVYLDMPSVGATINTMFAAVKAEGITIIENAAKEPEVVSVATFLNNMGADIKGAGTSEIIINGVQKLGKGFTEVIPDRIEAGTYMILGALLGNPLKITNIIPEHVDSLTLKLKEMGVNIKVNDSDVEIYKTDNLKPVVIKTHGYPGFPTDLQQPLTVLLTQLEGKSSLQENIYENRFQNVPYLIKMGANIEFIDNQNINIYGKTPLKGTEVEATDLRAGSCMVLAGLLAEGTTTITNIEHVLRGYENIEQKLKNVGAKIDIIEI